MQYTDFLLEEISVSILAFANSMCSVISECFLMYIVLVKSGIRTKLKKLLIIEAKSCSSF